MHAQINAAFFGKRAFLVSAALCLFVCILLLGWFSSPTTADSARKTAGVPSTNWTMAVVSQDGSAHLRKVPPEDQKAARRLISRTMLRQQFQDFSLHKMWNLPRSLYGIQSLGFVEFTLAPDSAIQVTTTQGRYWWLKKGTTGWMIKGEQPVPFFIYIDGVNVSPQYSESGMQSFQQEESFSDWLPKHSSISLEIRR